VQHLQQRKYQNFGDILDEVLKELNIKQIYLTKKYKIDHSTICTDRRAFLTRRRMMKYWKFIEDHNLNEDFILQGYHPIIVDQITRRNETQVIIDNLLKEKAALEKTLAGKVLEIEKLRAALKFYIDKYGKRKEKKSP